MCKELTPCQQYMSIRGLPQLEALTAEVFIIQVKYRAVKWTRSSYKEALPKKFHCIFSLSPKNNHWEIQYVNVCKAVTSTGKWEMPRFPRTCLGSSRWLLKCLHSHSRSPNMPSCSQDCGKLSSSCSADVTTFLHCLRCAAGEGKTMQTETQTQLCSASFSLPFVLTSVCCKQELLPSRLCFPSQWSTAQGALTAY